MHAGAFDEQEFETWRTNRARQRALRFVLCGSVDDGKSTLLGRLLWETGNVERDTLARLRLDSKRVGTQGTELDLALLSDGLLQEREQGITIDVAYRYFASERCSFVALDAPGHVQYTRNLVVAASKAEAALVLVDAFKGITEQTLRHGQLARLMGIEHVALVVNKLDRVGYSQARVADLEAQWRAQLGHNALEQRPPSTVVALSALTGEQVATASLRLAWQDLTLLGYLESVAESLAGEGEESDEAGAAPGHLMVSWVARPDSTFRGYGGRVRGGSLRAGDRVRTSPGGQESTIARLWLGGEALEEAQEGQSVTLELSDELGISRGEVLATGEPIASASACEATLVWLDAEPLVSGTQYEYLVGSAHALAKIAAPSESLELRSGQWVAMEGETKANAIVRTSVQLDRRVAMAPYAEQRALGGFTLVDRVSGRTVGCGLIERLSHGSDIHWSAGRVDRQARAELKGQRGGVLWLTGTPGSGKSTLAQGLEARLYAAGHHTMVLDGDNVRHGLSRDLGFSAEDRREQVRRVSEVARLMVEAGLVVIVSLVSPERSAREEARALFSPGEFLEAYVKASLATTQARDPKGLYAKAARGEASGVSGLDAPYEAPEAPDVTVDTETQSEAQSVQALWDAVEAAGWLRP